METGNPKESIDLSLELVSELSKVIGCKFNIQKHIAFLFISNVNEEIKY